MTRQPNKIALGAFSIIFGIIFTVQYYVLYKGKPAYIEMNGKRIATYEMYNSGLDHVFNSRNLKVLGSILSLVYLQTYCTVRIFIS